MSEQGAAKKEVGLVQGCLVVIAILGAVWLLGKVRNCGSDGASAEPTATPSASGANARSGLAPKEAPPSSRKDADAKEGEPATPAKGPPLPVGVYRTIGGHVAATTKEKLDKAFALVTSGDRQAFERYLETEPGVIVLKEGLEVHVVEGAGLLGSTVKIRKRGELLELWTVREALDIR